MKEAISEIGTRLEGKGDPLLHGVTKEGITTAMMFKSDIQHCVTDIVADAIKERHKNGMAKHWGAAVLDLIKMCLVLEYKDDAKRKRLNNWKSHCGVGVDKYSCGVHDIG